MGDPNPRQVTTGSYRMLRMEKIVFPRKKN